jgi:hypothetical protein
MKLVPQPFAIVRATGVETRHRRDRATDGAGQAEVDQRVVGVVVAAQAERVSATAPEWLGIDTGEDAIRVAAIDPAGHTGEGVGEGHRHAEADSSMAPRASSMPISSFTHTECGMRLYGVLRPGNSEGEKSCAKASSSQPLLNE